MYPDEEFVHQQIGQKYDKEDSKVPLLGRSFKK
jgi:hypothetical protein